MRKIKEIHKNEEGFILVVGMSILVVLTLIGISGTRNSVIELKIAGNEREIAQKFYVADTTWKIGGLWLNDKPTAPDIVNVTPKTGDTQVDLDDKYYAMVRNYGAGGDNALNDTFGSGTEDGSYKTMPFWYRVIYNGDKIALKYGEGYRDFNMGIESIADGSTGISTRMYKVYRVGY